MSQEVDFFSGFIQNKQKEEIYKLVRFGFKKQVSEESEKLTFGISILVKNCQK